MSNKYASAILGTLLGLSFGASAAFAAMPAPSPAIMMGGTMSSDRELLQEAKVTINVGVNGGYNRRMHGNRCDYRHDNCRHFYRGHYYQNQWWTFPFVVGGTIGNSHNHRLSNNHVQWCQDHYRSYNIRTNTWLSNSGQYRQCNSPY